MSIIKVNTNKDYYEDGDYVYSSNKTFYDDPNFGAYAGIGSSYKFTDNLYSAISLNIKFPINNQNAENATDDRFIYEAEADDYHPLFIYLSFSVGYMF